MRLKISCETRSSPNGQSFMGASLLAVHTPFTHDLLEPQMVPSAAPPGRVWQSACVAFLRQNRVVHIDLLAYFQIQQ